MREAIEDSAVSRLRPILMTSLSTVLGILPMAMATGAGAESRVAMGIAVVGGMVCSTLLITLRDPGYLHLPLVERSKNNRRDRRLNKLKILRVE